MISKCNSLLCRKEIISLNFLMNMILISLGIVNFQHFRSRNLISFSDPPPDHHDLSLQSYTVEFSFDRLVPGVDNIHYDVHLSPALCQAAAEIVFHLIIKHSKATEIPDTAARSKKWTEVKEIFKSYCVDVMLAAINKAKLEREIQINYLVQIAVAKMLMEEIRTQYSVLVEHYKRIIRKNEISHTVEIASVIKLKDALSEIQKNNKTIIRLAADELFGFLAEIQYKELRKIREANFGADAILPDDFFTNPLLYIENAVDDFFMTEAYVLFGNRLEDPIKYDTVLNLLTNFISQYDLDIPARIEEDPKHLMPPHELPTEIEEADFMPPLSMFDNLIMHTENIDMLFNYFESESQLTDIKRKKGSKNELQFVRTEIKNRKSRLRRLNNQLKKAGLVETIIASYVMKPVYTDYCPPLLPHEVLKFLTSPRERHAIISKLKRLRTADKQIALKPLNKVIQHLNRMKKESRNEHIIRFFRDFSRYHKDLQNYRIIEKAMGWIQLATDDKTINLSRINHTLYEFLLPKEQIYEEKPIVNHVIIKTDIRGSTDITHQIKERGLNPASYFSLNFFNPITAILSEYGAEKVFIEGDAIILSIFEKEETPEDWYSVARACGLAINMLMITQRYNAKSKKHRFPILEQGIGICYRNTPPTFLFDGDNRIMISPAINHADRLSGCSKMLRKKLEPQKGPFNLYVFQTTPDEEMAETADDLFARYNVNGIELNAEGFEKLKEEINLTRIDCNLPDFWKSPFVIYTGIFPTMSGKYQRLVIREAPIPLLKSNTFGSIRMTHRRYYEVCTQRRLYEHAKQIAKTQ